MDINESKYLYIRPPKEALWAMTVFLALASVFMAVKINGEWRGYGRTIPPNTIMVSGEGKVLVKPDIAVVNIGVIKEDADLGKVQQNTAEIMGQLAKFLKENKVDEKDIKTTSYSISPRYDYKEGEQKLRGYEVFQNLEVKIRDLGKVGAVLSGAAARGANQVGSLTFSVDDPKKAKEEARAIAIKDAREKAGRLSADLGVSLKKIVNYGESGGGGPQPIYAQADFGFGKGGGFPVPAPSGENEIIITVNLTYEIK
ncbi:MAG: hypothetical protein UW81_C0020G0009 [Candidatus Giovannonibacteria bacterium GW2011_GWC2_44_9]|uniref:26 kDa periplasmic immunogenic protein n=3 Tax=Candidatus Giovannoniibacteriota TaxID=1752738 RepID=A0A0G1IUB9_9BACT|nr:MAG: hypothetical protein UW49_C0013G0008 [Candidatus Giovannonibacteria bacterium GW2011_GWB1_44_23]KKT62951.1 MAG: hypothetical protein UW57_C0011G0008 [Candidatus Giovannonibacteria bacterium GW2011_GWA1_44_29]KKT83357.1 MAG: hypothetical protein UW81_C0020G0009 [Candidatus Giovannonibacteria bacterium GW2011_GWC2_44_9]KKT91486.1 MAG: hypothetical protein UW93_C0006G0037 [Parcubacteria group bacterium GW2011_GWC1_45_13]